MGQHAELHPPESYTRDSEQLRQRSVHKGRSVWGVPIMVQPAEPTFVHYIIPPLFYSCPQGAVGPVDNAVNQREK